MNARRQTILRGVLALALGSLPSCGGAPKPMEPEAAPPPPPPAAPKLHMQTELGQIDPAATEATWKKLQPAIMSCYQDGQRRVDYLGGDLKFFLRVGQDGSAKYVYLVDTTLGDRKTERCMLDVAQGATWPQPEGGEAEVQKSMGFDPPSNIRAPFDWPSDKVSAALAPHQTEISKCKGDAQGTFRATAYVEPRGRGGHVTTAGFATSSKDGDSKVDCLVDVLKKLKMPSPGSYAAKVSFTL